MRCFGVAPVHAFSSTFLHFSPIGGVELVRRVSPGFAGPRRLSAGADSQGALEWLRSAGCDFANRRFFFRVLSKPPPAPPYNVSHPRVERTVQAKGARRASLRPVRSHAKGWAGLGTPHGTSSIFIYSKPGEPSPAQKNFLRTRRTLTWYVRRALKWCPLGS